MDLQFTLDFLSDLAKHNKKEWMDENKKRYLQAKEEVIELISEVIKKTAAFHPGVAEIDPKKTLFRINRDVRFSKNKDPYKTNFGASITSGGRKSGNPGFYLHIMPENNFAGGGLYQPPSDVLQKIRQEIDYNGKELRSIIEEKKFSDTYSEPYSEDKLKTAPKGYPKDHEHIDLLQLKHFIYMRKYSDKEVTSNDFTTRVVESYRTLNPYLQFLSRALD
ncbi:DUF2461 domain-containing protein [Ekhidna sp.]|uniref:DUF2461 domain-containing protein n=1 Tax=Ekhidna sp. TaxID=2608089 RepID=UPI003B50FCCB